ncbi:N-6 DNA methylase [Devosia sp. Leaf64]|uniref:Eco57I restriction-modification methylase domain-containing protein n=1 Tax=Devosia sp. Leaf64 TaxID=1736229 RepID=UPI0009EAE6F8|nr:N-6 DNA methylase [Devosia sp. Leaf64]
MSATTPEYSQKRSGAYFTPSDVSASLVAWACRTPSERLLDPSCGDGEFLVLHPNSVGIEQNPLSARLAIERAPGALVHEGDFFAWASETNERFECAAGNPPFIRFQSFSGELRRRAIKLCERLGANFSGLTSSWAPFLVATAGLLKPNGRMSFVVPAEIGHAPYAAPLLDFLVSSFSTVHILAVRQKLFPALSEDCWLLYADGYGGVAKTIDFTDMDTFRPSMTVPPPTVRVDIAEWQTVWNRRLRPYLLPAAVRDLYASVLADPGTTQLGEFAQVGIGYVSGDNSFFHLRPSQAKHLKIPPTFLQPSLRNGRSMPPAVITQATVEQWRRSDDPILLLHLPKNGDIPATVRSYLNSSEGQRAREGYKCRNRAPWYAVPDVQIPQFMMSYGSGRSVNLVRNDAGVSCTNSVHAVRIRDYKRANELLPYWSSPFVRLSCELEGHALGGGMLKLEPREASRVLFPAMPPVRLGSADELEDAIVLMQHWRHYDG